jgi:hypothetical protein
MKTFRTSAHDAPVRSPVIKPGKPGANLPPGRIAVIDENGNRHGHVSRATGTEATARRLGVRNAALKKVGGKLVWQGETTAPNRAAVAKLAQQRIVAKSSVTKNPTKPALARRPERGG